MSRFLILLLPALVGGCGAEVAGTAAVTGAARAREAEALQPLPDKIRQDIDAVAASARNRLEEAERTSTR